LVFIILAVCFLIVPLIGEIKDSSTIAKEENSELQTLKNTDRNYIKKLESDYTNARDNISLFKINLNEKQIIDFIVDLEKAADRSSNYLEIKSAEFPGFNLAIAGNFQNLMKFLGWIENSTYLISIESVNIRQLIDSPGDLRTILEIKLPTNKLESQNESTKNK